MRFEVIPFERDHAEALDIRASDRLVVSSIGHGICDLAVEYASRGPCLTAMWGGNVVAVVGVILLWNGVGEGWAMTSDLVPRVAKSFHRAVLVGLNRIWNEYNLHRVQLVVHDRNIVSQRWVKRMGFEFEGILIKYGPDGSNYYRYARTR